MEVLWRDLRYALRSLGRTKLVTLVATLSLALAIAGNATVFSLISGLFIRPLPYDEPERIVLVGVDYRGSHSVFRGGQISGASLLLALFSFGVSLVAAVSLRPHLLAALASIITVVVLYGATLYATGGTNINNEGSVPYFILMAASSATFPLLAVDWLVDRMLRK